MTFDYFFAIDWSARNRPSPVRPSKDAIWVGEAPADGRISATYFRTRQACMDYLEQQLLSLHGKRVLVGWDFSLGYPKGLARALSLKEKPVWRAIWDHLSELVTDDARNQNNRFCVGAMLNERIQAPCGPFWGVPAGQSGIFLGSKRDFDYPVPTRKGFLRERRAVEKLNLRMQPAWKLAYTGSVGSQSLLGIPRVRTLRDHAAFRDISHVWPFESGGADAGAAIVHAEIYPSLLTVPRSADGPLDRDQVTAYVGWLQERQEADALAPLLDRPWGPDEKLHKRVTGHEGWVLGLTVPDLRSGV